MNESLDGFEEKVKENIQKWLSKDFDEKTKEAILTLLKNDPKALADAFYQKLAFGTAGIRGVMGPGINRINAYTIRAATEGLCQYIKEKNIKAPSVVIGYDNRNFSKFFANQAARVLASHKIIAYVYDELRPTPFISFSCRYLKCTAAIMITASHNAPEYNGFKVFWSDGGQVLPPHDKKIIEKVNNIEDLEKIALSAEDDPFIKRLSTEYDDIYLKENLSLNTFSNEKKNLSLLYTNLHGAGITLIPKALEQWGFNNLSYVEEQTSIDGNFPFAKRPNPEEDDAMEPGKEKMEKEKIDLFIASDPDSDRIGAFALHNGQGVRITGNEMACLCLYYLGKTTPQKKNAFCVKTIVTSELFSAIAKSFNYECKDVLTGFKYIGQEVENNPNGFVFGAEESCGYLYGTNVRDKDAVILACLIAEMAQSQKNKNKTLVDLLHELYEEYGVYRETLVAMHFPETAEGQHTMQKIMDSLRTKHIEKIDNTPVVITEDYLSQEKKEEGKTAPLSLPKSNVVRIFLEDQTKIIIRPSGTEPKIKVYFGAVQKEGKDLQDKIALCDKKLEHLHEVINHMIFEK
jgi:phosphomannomutase